MRSHIHIINCNKSYHHYISSRLALCDGCDISLGHVIMVQRVCIHIAINGFQCGKALKRLSMWQTRYHFKVYVMELSSPYYISQSEVCGTSTSTWIKNGLNPHSWPWSKGWLWDQWLGLSARLQPRLWKYVLSYPCSSDSFLLYSSVIVVALLDLLCHLFSNWSVIWFSIELLLFNPLGSFISSNHHMSNFDHYDQWASKGNHVSKNFPS